VSLSPGATAHLDTLRGFGEAEQLAEILKQHDTLAQQAKDWGKLAELAGKRKPAWERLCTLLKHADSMPGADELRKQADAVKSERRLLDASDPVPDVRKAAVDALRAAVTAAHAEYEKTYNEQMASLTASDNWKKLKADQRQTILADEGIDELPALAVGAEADLIRKLEQTPLPAWKTRTDALPQQFARAAAGYGRGWACVRWQMPWGIWRCWPSGRRRLWAALPTVTATAKPAASPCTGGWATAGAVAIARLASCPATTPRPSPSSRSPTRSGRSMTTGRTSSANRPTNSARPPKVRAWSPLPSSPLRGSALSRARERGS